MNMALLAKLAWRILTEPTSVIAKVLNAKYGGKKGWFTNDFIKKDTSNIGNGLRAGMQQLKGNVVWKIGSGDHVMLGLDPWVSKLSRFYSMIKSQVSNSCLSSS